MKYILDDKKILNFFVENKISMTNFAREIHSDPRVLNNVLDGKPVRLSTAQKISNAMNLHPSALILCSFSKREREHHNPDERWWLSK